MKEDIFLAIRKAIDCAPRNQFMAELHLQMIKYADDLHDITAKEFCQEVELKPSYGTEFSKMRNLTNRLKQAGLDVTKI
ncbi:HTH-like domain-containing protein [Vibrio sp. DNB22_10_4]